MAFASAIKTEVCGEKKNKIKCDDEKRGAVSPVVGHSLITRAARVRFRVQA